MGRRLVLSILLVLSMAVASVGAQTTLTVYSGYPAGSPVNDVLESYFRLYEQLNPGITIENLGREHNPDVLITMFLGGEAPDVIELASEVLVRFYQQGLLSPAPTSLADQLRATNYPISVDTLTLDGVVIAVPNENMTTGLMYNKRVLAESGVAAPPATLDELEMVGRRLTRLAADGSIQLAGLVEAGENWSLNHFGLALLEAEGGQVIDADGRIALDADPVYRVIDRFLAWTGGSGGQPFLGLGWDQAAAFWQGNIGLGLGYTFWMGEARNASPVAYPDEFGVALLPRGTAGYGALHYGHGYAVPAQSENKDEAWKFLEWLNQAEIDGITPTGHAMAVVGSLPVNRADIMSIHFADERPLYEGFIAGLDYSVDIAQHAPYGVSNANLGTIILSVIGGSSSPQQAVQAAVADIRSQMEQVLR